jgi:ectoine hydroxylase-related dioxygenase (phytanoyl-CoA dioxygenase family)
MRPMNRLGSLSAHLGAGAAATTDTVAATCSTDDTGAAFQERGFCLLPGLLDARQTARLQSSFRREQARHAAEPAARYADIPRCVETDEIYLELLESRRLAALLTKVVGSDAHCIGIQGRAVASVASAPPPVEPSISGGTDASDGVSQLDAAIAERRRALAAGAGYAGWHRDYERGASHLNSHGPFRHPRLCQSAKLFVLVADCDDTMGCTAVVPYSQNDPANPPLLEDPATQMPGLFRFSGKAGDAMLIDFHIWHAAMPNNSGRARESLIIQFAAFKWQQTGTFLASAQRLEAAGALTGRPILRQMLGLEIADELADPGPYPPESSVTSWPRLLPGLAPPPVRDGAVTEEVAAFRRDGYLMLPGLLPGKVLATLQHDFRREQAATRAAFDANGKGGRVVDGQVLSRESERFFDLPGDTVVETSPAYLDLLELPRLVALLEEVVGEDVKAANVSNFHPCPPTAMQLWHDAHEALPAAREQQRVVGTFLTLRWNFLQVQARTVPLWSQPGLERGHSYTTWHRDFGRNGKGEQWHWPFDHPTLSEDVKLFVNIFDTAVDQGCSAVVPKSHKLLASKPAAAMGMKFAGGSVLQEAASSDGVPLEAMPGHVRLSGKAGDCMLADIRTWHTALANHTDKERESLIVFFTPFWRKGGLVASAQRLEAGGRALSPRLRQMLGLELMGGGNIYDPEWLAANPRADLV